MNLIGYNSFIGNLGFQTNPKVSTQTWQKPGSSAARSQLL